jgi:hypothetical protein
MVRPEAPSQAAPTLQSKETEMRVMILAKGGGQSAAATPPTPAEMAEFEKYDQELVKSGVVLASGRLAPIEEAKRIRFDGQKRSVLDGPYAESKEVVGGYWLWEVRSMDEALEWLKRAPFNDGTFEVRQVSQHEGG